jgi:hypothetical protein
MYSFNGKDEVMSFRFLTLISGLKLETKGIRMTRKGPTCYSILKKEYGFKGSREAVLKAAQELVQRSKAQ